MAKFEIRQRGSAEGWAGIMAIVYLVASHLTDAPLSARYGKEGSLKFAINKHAKKANERARSASEVSSRLSL